MYTERYGIEQRCYEKNGEKKKRLNLSVTGLSSELSAFLLSLSLGLVGVNRRDKVGGAD